MKQQSNHIVKISTLSTSQKPKPTIKHQLQNMQKTEHKASMQKISKTHKPKRYNADKNSVKTTKPKSKHAESNKTKRLFIRKNRTLMRFF